MRALEGLHGGAENEVASVLGSLKTGVVGQTDQRVQKIALMRELVLHVHDGADVADEGDAHDDLAVPVKDGKAVQRQMPSVGKGLDLGHGLSAADDFGIDGHVEHAFRDNARGLASHHPLFGKTAQLLILFVDEKACGVRIAYPDAVLKNIKGLFHIFKKHGIHG